MFKKIKRGLSVILATSLIGATSCSSFPITFAVGYDTDYEKTIEDIKTVDEAINYCLNYLTYCDDTKQYGKECWVSFKKIHASKKDDCDGGAVAAAALLSDDGYSPIMLCMYGKTSGHAVFLYKENGKYGSIGINNCDCNPADFDSIDDLIKYLDKALSGESMKAKARKDKEDKFVYYRVLDFSNYTKELKGSDDFLDDIVDKIKKNSEIHYLK